MRTAGITVLVFLLLALVQADVYMHNPRGSNNRNCERDVNRKNANRLFDSENNSAGGYACPRAVGGPETVTPKMYYYAGSELTIEWTAQHGCGKNPRVRCEIVLQYMCGANVRDGTPKDMEDPAVTTIPDTPEGEQDPNFGMHENREHYTKCKTRQRNMGLFTADRWLRGTSAIYTRQNNGGERFGYECAEENEYYPYWHPTPWKDIAVLVDDTSRCKYFTDESQNVRNKGECIRTNGPALGEGPRATSWYNNKQECESVDPKRKDAEKDKTQKWVESGAWGLNPPECLTISETRSNHLGNAEGTGEASRYVWKIPADINENCVLRMRYNLSSTDFPINTNSTYNGKNSPIKQDPYVYIDGTKFLSLALNTNQYFRTFQDRSYVFAIRRRPPSIPDTARVINFNVRGKRGNIVQTFPSVEYDFIPNEMTFQTGTYVHFQWTGSDYNPRRGCNNGEGGPPDKLDNDPKKNSRADRSNLVEMAVLDNNYPKTANGLVSTSMFSDVNTIMKLAYLGQTDCMTMEELEAIKNREERENHPRNCAKLNAATTPYFDAGAIRMRKPGTYNFMSTRNNNFSNRDQKGRFVITGAPLRRNADAEETDINNLKVSTADAPHYVEFNGANQTPAEVPEYANKDEIPMLANEEVDNSNTGDGQQFGCDGFMLPIPFATILASALAVIGFFAL